MPKRYIPNDTWSQKAAKEGYRARSVYKLQELDEKFRLIAPGMTVLDLGAAPGSWLQYVQERVGSKGKIIGLDLTEIEPIKDVKTYVCDITDVDAVRAILHQENIEKVDLILSDLAPKTSGIKDVDQWKSIELSESVINIADEFLKDSGTCVLKILRGADFDEFFKAQKKKWEKAKTAIVRASRDRSREVYVLLKR